MPVEAQTVEYSYLGDGVSTVFGFPSRFLSNDDLFVALNGVIQVAGFTITGAGTDDGGEVTFAVPPGNLVRVMLVRNPSPSQLVDFENGQTVLEGTLDNALDKLTMIAQYLLRAARRSVRIDDAAYTTENPTLLSLPVVTARLSKILAFDENGAIEMIDRAGFEQLMQDAIAAATTSVAAAASAESSAQAAAEVLSDIQLLINGLSSFIRRKYIMTAGQTDINVGAFTTSAVLVYYDGVLLDPLGEYTLNPPLLTLAAGAAAGAQIDMVEFKGVSIAGAMIGSNDLADVSSKKNSRQNLELTKVMTGPNAAASISADSRVVHVLTALTAPRVYTLPAANAVNPGEAVEVFDTILGVTAVNTLTIQRAGADTINGGTSVVLANAGAAVRLVSDGVSKWAYQVIGQDVIDGQCRLVLNGANLELQRFNGRRIWIGTAAQVIPASPPTLAATGLTPGTVYYIYAYMNSGVMTLEASTTAPVADTSFGHQIKTGDSSRSLVGMARPVTGPAWVDTAADRGVISFFNRRALSLSNRYTTNRTTTSTTSVEIDTEIRCKFLSWGDDAVALATAGAVNHSVSGDAIFVAINLDGATDYGRSSSGQATTANASAVRAAHIPAPAIGGHYATVFGNVAGAGTGTFFGGTNNFVALTGTVFG